MDVTTGVTSAVTILGSIGDVIGDNPVLFAFVGLSLIGAGFAAFAKAKRSVK